MTGDLTFHKPERTKSCASYVKTWGLSNKRWAYDLLITNLNAFLLSKCGKRNLGKAKIETMCLSFGLDWGQARVPHGVPWGCLVLY